MVIGKRGILGLLLTSLPVVSLLIGGMYPLSLMVGAIITVSLSQVLVYRRVLTDVALIATVSGSLAFTAFTLLYMEGVVGASLIGLGLAVIEVVSYLAFKPSFKYLSQPRRALVFLLSTFNMLWWGSLMGAVALGDAGPSLSQFLGQIMWVTPFYTWWLWDIFTLFTSVTSSPLFLISIGLSYLPLILQRMREARKRENKVRIALMMLAFFLYSLYIPSFSPLSNEVQFIPYMWFNGLGTFGPLTLSLVPALVGTYLIYGIMAFLFGSRHLCSVTCTAPYMYQNAFQDSLKKYNRTASLGRKGLTSRTPWWYRVVAISVTLVTAFASLLSFLSNYGIVKASVMGIDISSLASSVVFNFLFYIMFVGAPLTGTYSCVTQGWCYWGLFSQAVGRVGLFRVKARDPQACLTCRTVDCANACPVGLTDLRGQFVKKGEFRAMKCIGSGECVDACPHDNIFIYDVRHKIKEIRLGGK